MNLNHSSSKKSSLLTINDIGLYNNCVIYVRLKRGVKGGNPCPMKFTDISKNVVTDIKESNEAPSYRKGHKGCNVFGK